MTRTQTNSALAKGLGRGRRHLPGAAARNPRSFPLPWTPVQIMAITYLCGPLAGGVAAGLNFKRMGKDNLAVPSILLGAVLFGAVLVVMALTPGWGGPVGGALNLLFGLVFLWLHKPTFAGWKLACWATEAHEGDTYRPGRHGQLFLVGLGCVLLEVALIVGLLSSGLLR